MNNRILDSGDRTEFSTGAVRDVQQNKGRFDLLPLDVVADLMEMQGIKTEYANVLREIERYKETKDAIHLRKSLFWFCKAEDITFYKMQDNVSMYYKACLEKYPDEDNWKKGIPVKSYLSSGSRHLSKRIFSWEDEQHDNAFVWNMLAALWTIEHKPELIDAPFDMVVEEEKELDQEDLH